MKDSYFSEEQVKNPMSLKILVQKMWPYLWKQKWVLLLVLTLVVGFVAVSRALPALFGYAIDEGIRKKDMDIIYILAGIYLGLELMRSLLSFAQSYSIQKLGNKALYDLRENLITHVQNLNIQFFDKNPVGRTVTRLTNDIAAMGELFSQGFTAIFVNTIEIVSILIALSLLSLPLTAATVIVAPIILFISIKISERIRGVFKEAKRKLSTINAFTAESLNGMKILQLFNKTEPSVQYFSKVSKEYRNLQLGTVKLFALLWPLLEGFNVATVATALFFGAYFRDTFSLSIGTLTAFILYLQGFFRPLRVILERYSQMQNSLASADRVFSILDEPVERMVTKKDLPAQLEGSIAFENLNFQYGGSESPMVLKDICLNIRPGESIAFVGRTGSGKTTMISLLQQLYEYKVGHIKIDGRELNQLNRRQIRSRIGVVQQNNFIFKGTVSSNINLENPKISQQQVYEAARLTGCLEILERRRGGLEAPVEEGGANLSVGERQLIAFARVLAFDPDIFILDEATANIDSESEQLIQRATEIVTKSRTSIIIAHRLSTIQKCDRIVVMSKGEIIEVGSHEELLAKKGRYHDLYQAQFKDKTDERGPITPSL